MLGVLFKVFLTLTGLVVVFLSPFSALSALLIFNYLRSLVHPYANSTATHDTRHQRAAGAIADGPAQSAALSWSELLTLVSGTVLVLVLASLVPRHLVYLAKSCRLSLAVKRFLARCMGYDPARPATWSIAQLRLYAAEHNISIPSGCEKSELVALVDECLTNALLAEHIRKENVLDDAVLPDILAATTDTILRHRAYPGYARTLRQHPKKLQEIIEAGLHQLESLTFVAQLCGAQLLSPLSAWLDQVAHAEDGGASFQAALTPAEGAAAVSAVCGRLCGDGDMVVRCLDCGADPTCVMCMDCFRHSPCVNHRYRITQGSGGGMCDCGDPTAWKPESFCSKHRPVAAAGLDNGGGATSAPSPVDTLAEEDREWVVVLLRGTVQYIALALLQNLRICAAQKRAKTKAKSASLAPQGGGLASTASEDPEAALMADVALIADAYDWLAGWLTPVTNRLSELVSTTEVAKQIVAQLWTEPLCLCAALDGNGDDDDDEEKVPDRQHEKNSPSGVRVAARAAASAKQNDAILAALPDTFSCLHPVFLFETLRPVTAHERPLRDAPPDLWSPVLAKCVSHCLSVSKLRMPVGALMATYAECMNAHEVADDGHYPLRECQVQVLTNPDVLMHLMTPAHMPYRNATNTVVHRVLSSILYSLSVCLDQGPRNAILRTSSVATDGLIFIEHQNGNISYGGVSVMGYSLYSLPAACYTLVLNRLAWRAFLQIHGTLAISGYINADPDAPTDSSRFPAPDFYGRTLSRHMWLWFNAMRGILTALMRLPADDSNKGTGSTASMPGIAPADFTAALQVPHAMWQRWTEATRFDAPPDTSRRRRVFLQMLGSCKVENGREEALLIIQNGGLAAAQMAAIQQHVAEAAAASRDGRARVHDAAAGTTTAMSAPLAAAVGYAVQVLYEISRTMDAVFQKQRDGFCQRCHTIALERDGRPGTAVMLPEAESAAAKEEGNVQRGDGRPTPSAAVTATTLSAEKGRNEEEEGEGESSPSLPSSPALPPSQSPIDVFEYNLLQPALHATTFSNHLPRMFGAVLTAWVIEQQRQRHAPAAAATTRLSGLCDDAVQTTSPASSSSTHLARPLHTLLDCFFKLRATAMPHLVQDRLTTLQQLLDALVMPQVLMGQVFDGLWRRDSYGVSAAAGMYIGYCRSVVAEFDVLMLQVLTMELAPADMAIQILRRFSYAKQSASAKAKVDAALAAAVKKRGAGAASRTRHLAFRRYLKGYRHYLRLMLTLVVDTTKASFHPPLSSHCIERTVAHFLAQKKVSHSAILKVVSDYVRGGDFGIAEEDEKDTNGKVIRFTQVIDAAVKKLAVAQDSSRGKQFRLRDVPTWKAHVNLYQSSIFDSQLEEIHSNYRSIALVDEGATQPPFGEGEDGSNASSSADRHALPPTQLFDDAMYAELLPTTRSLLHTDALLLPALYVLHEYTNAHAPPATTATGPSFPLACTEEVSTQSPRNDASAHQSLSSGGGTVVDSYSSSSDSEDDDDNDDDEDTNFISREALLHAVTALYLCVQDCRSITRAMQAVERANDNDDDTTTPGAAHSSNARGGDRGDAISWDLVELYLRRYRVNELSFTPSSSAQVLPLPELTGPSTLLHKLQTHVTLHCLASATSNATTVRVTSAEMLHRLRTHLNADKGADIYSCLEMVEEVLVLTGMATFDAAAASAEQRLKEEAARSRKKLIQERQAKLMQRMRSRVLKTTVDKGASSTSAAGTTANTSEKSRHAVGSPSSSSAKVGAAANNVSGSLLTKVLLELATLDCCVCHAATEEPLFLLCHTSTSSVLPQLGALTLPDDRGVHNHLCTCGHAAHKTCVEKLFVRLSVLWQRWNFRSQLYLGPTEFNCPLCNMIVSTLAPVPSLSLGAMAPASPGVPSGATSLFEELQSGTVHPKKSGSGAGKDRTEDVVVEFQTNLANSAVGFSPSEDIPPLVTTEDALQKGNEAAWILSETMRTFFYSSHLLLEGVKAGQSIGHRHLISLLSLLVSLMPAKLQAAQAALRENFKRTAKDEDCLLLLDALLKPREASHLICAHVEAQVFPGMPHDYLERLLACAERATTTTDAAAEVEAEDEEEQAAVPASAFQRSAEALEADFPGVTIAVWKAMGVLTLLKALLVEDASHAIILSSASFTVAGTVTFTTLHSARLRTPAARCTAIVRMMQYVLPVPHKSSSEQLAVVAQDLLRWVGGDTATTQPAAVARLPHPGALPYTGADAYVAQIAETLLHLPRVYATLLTAFAEHKRCAVCQREAANPVLCCRCGQHMCMHRQRSGSPPELYQHVRACGGAVGVFLAVRLGTFYVMELTCGRLYAVQTNYTDEYGERDRNLNRGVPLFRDREETQKLIELWMQNKWGAVSIVFANSNRLDLTEL
ncbi:putative ubiquitin ligase [Leptomonas pyrrhocoris]|uniref:E3 ubiquitin-protein ligase n=1 Tax=Leptomonas pyrrhocoris TaxID=157538 RepID=A0A0N0VE71_LEPPY|nr:putative ubiquitin ligase [Leptomonas pyrrhocoris]KPA77578.1 putative ubiquitin ligase [Leptomonas pyrrhocoris]|eukprot:XP_015656017.1 putative ubiquitin ligase [Leptomonas pyrrhocoris]